MDSLESYYQAVRETLEGVRRTETETIRRAGRLIGESLAKGRLLHVFGTVIVLTGGTAIAPFIYTLF